MTTTLPSPLTPEQCRLARELLGWDMLDLAEASGVRMVVLMKIEDGRKPVPALKVERVRRALEEASVEFVPGGAKLREDPSAEEATLPQESGEKP